MTYAQLSGSFRHRRVLIVGLLALAACADSAPTVPSPTEISLAAAAGGNGPTGKPTGPTVKSTDPDSATVDTRLDVRVFGSGYDQGSRANWAFKGVVSEKIVTNSTLFVSSTELVANITIAPNANIGSHDVIVTTSTGKPGIGTELFVVTLKTTATTLPTFGGTTAEALAINDAGTVVGYASETNASRTVGAVTYAARWARDAEGRWQVTKLSPTSGGRALALNELGDAVGTRNGSALVWPASGGEIALPDGAAAQGINNAKIIVGGTVWGNTGVARVWIPDGSASGWTPRPLRLLEGGTYSIAFAINERGVIAGVAVSAAGFEQAVVWLPEADGWSSPVLLFGTEASDGSSGGFGINARGDVVGYQSLCSGCGFRAYFWPASGASVNLTALEPNASGSHARGIEDDGRVVGHFNAANGSTNPFLWNVGNTTLTDLGTGRATDINNRTAFYGQEAVGSRAGSRGGAEATVWRVP